MNLTQSFSICISLESIRPPGTGKSAIKPSDMQKPHCVHSVFQYQACTLSCILVLLLNCTDLTVGAPCFQDCRVALELHSIDTRTPLFDVRSFGADLSGTLLSTSAVNLAINAAAEAVDQASVESTISSTPSFAFVYFPPGTVSTGAFNLSSNVYLCLADGAEIRASDSATDYLAVDSITSDTGEFDYPFIGLYDIQNSGIIGSATGPGIQGIVNGGLNSPPGNHIRSYDPTLNFLLPEEWPLPNCSPFACRPKLVVAHNSSSLTFSGASLLNSAFWTLTLSESSDILIDSMYIEGDRRYPNNDGVDCISCQDMVVQDTEIRTGDDCIAMIAHSSQPTSNLTLQRLQLSSTSSAIHLAVFDANASGDVSDIQVTDVTITDSNRGINISPRWGTSNLSALRFTNMSIETRWFSSAWWGVGEAITISAAWSQEDHTWNGTLNDVIFDHIDIRSEGGVVMYANTSQGISPLYDIQLLQTIVVIDRFSNSTTVMAVHDLRPSMSPSILPGPIDGIWLDGIEGLVVQDSSIIFAVTIPEDGECIRVEAGSSVKEINVNCIPPNSTTKYRYQPPTVSLA